ENVLLPAVVSLVAVPQPNFAVITSRLLVLPISHHMEKRPTPVAPAHIENPLILLVVGRVELHNREAVIIHPVDGLLYIGPRWRRDLVSVPVAAIAIVANRGHMVNA